MQKSGTGGVSKINMEYLYIAATIILTVYGQIIVKWRVVKYGGLPCDWTDKISFLLNLFLDPYILSGLLAAFLAAICWMAAMTKFRLSYAYPFTSLSFIFVLIFSALVLNESLNLPKILGIIIIIFGIFIGSQG